MTKRKCTKQHLKEQNAQAPDVNSLVVRDLFDNFVRVIAWSACLTSPCSFILRLRTYSCCKSKITQTNVELVIFNKYVFWLDVSMHNFTLVNAFKGLNKLCKDFARLFFIKMASWSYFHKVPQISKRIKR